MPAMWDRFRGAVPQKHGRPQFQQLQQQQQQHQSQQEPRQYAGGYSYSIQGGPPPPRPPREFVEQQMMQQYYQSNTAPAVQQPSPPVQQLPPQNTQHAESHRDSSFRPASSLYSQPSPLQTNFTPAPPKRSYTYDADDISPPSSPEPFATRDGLPQDISPIDEEPSDMFPEQPPQGQQARGGGGHIPSMRRERRQKMDAAASVLRETRSRERLRQPPEPRPVEHSGRGYHGGEVRWDPSTGELTSSDKGRPSQVKPAEYARGLGANPEGLRRIDEGQPAQPRNVSASFGERVRRIAQPGFATGGAEKAVTQAPQVTSPVHDPAGNMMAERPPWKGASGRTTLVEPVRENRDVAPLNIPRKSSKRAAGTRSPMATSPVQGSGIRAGMDTIMSSPPVSPVGPETRETIRQVVPSSQLLPSQMHQQSPPTIVTQDPAADYPSPPYSAGDVPPPLLTVETTGAGAGASSPPAPPPHLVQSPAALTPTSAIRRKPAPPSPHHTHHQQQDSISSVYSQNDSQFQNYDYGNYYHHQQASTSPPNPQLTISPPHHQQQDEVPWTQPPSRFSVTTYATSAHSTPRPSTDGFDPHDAPPMPTVPLMDIHPSPAVKQESVMDRRRPKLRSSGVSSGGTSSSSEDEPIVISLKDAGNWKSGTGKLAITKAMSSDQPGTSSSKQSRKPVGSGGGGNGKSPRPESIASVAGSVFKSLPPAPPESSAKDRADQLNAQLRSLANRRINIDRSIKQMTELMPTDNIMASAEVLHKREVERRKVEALKNEMAEVQREEYELGIKLHRAYKRMDREATFEPTTLWVRRVTG